MDWHKIGWFLDPISWVSRTLNDVSSYYIRIIVKSNMDGYTHQRQYVLVCISLKGFEKYRIKCSKVSEWWSLKNVK